MQKPNRIILTAARGDRTSFGCDAESDYTFWDECLIHSFSAAMPWLSLYRKIDECIRVSKERRERETLHFLRASSVEESSR